MRAPRSPIRQTATPAASVAAALRTSRAGTEAAHPRAKKLDDSFEEQLRMLMRVLGRTAAQAPHDARAAESEELLFSAEVDGVRCRFTRSRESSAPSIALPLAPALGEGSVRRGSPLLSPREREIARMVAKGHSDKTIAAVLEISKHTVATHLRRMYAKMGVPSRAAMIAEIMSHGSLE